MRLKRNKRKKTQYRRRVVFINALLLFRALFTPAVSKRRRPRVFDRTSRIARTSLLRKCTYASPIGWRRGTLRQRKGDYRIAEFGAELAVTAGGDDDKLFAVRPQAVGHRHRLATRRQPAFPQLSTGLDIERAQIIIHRCSYEDEPTGGDDRSSQIRRALHDMSGVFDQIGGCFQR